MSAEPQAPLSDDQLAIAYLKSRDVPCPGCGYNRRDGVACACPECQYEITIIPEQLGWRKHSNALASRYLMMLIILSAAHTLALCRSVFFWIDMMSNGSFASNIAYFYLAQASLGIVGYLTVITLSFNCRRTIRQGNTYTPAQASRPMLVYLIVAIIMLGSTYIVGFF